MRLGKREGRSRSRRSQWEFIARVRCSTRTEEGDGAAVGDENADAGDEDFRVLGRP